MLERNVVRVVFILCLVSAFSFRSDEFVAWAVYSCKVPNPETEPCGESVATVFSCAQFDDDQEACGDSVKIQERVHFPKGSITSTSGTTAQELADCSRTQDCYYDDDTESCQVGSWSRWSAGAKTVAGPNPCPTNEGA